MKLLIAFCCLLATAAVAQQAPSPWICAHLERTPPATQADCLYPNDPTKRAEWLGNQLEIERATVRRQCAYVPALGQTVCYR